MNVISHEELKKKIDSQKLAVLEILPLSYFEQGHLPGAIQSNVDELETTVRRLGLKRDSEIVTYCASETCFNSHKAADALAALGFTNVHVYMGGKKQWLDSGCALLK